MRLAVPRWRDGKCPNGDVNLITGEDGLARKGGSGPISSSGSFLMGAGGRHLLQKLCSCQDNFFPFECSRWCTRECGIDSYRPLFEEARAIKGVLLEACSRSEYSFGCFTCCRDYCLISFALVHSALVLFQHKVTCGVNSEFDR